MNGNKSVLLLTRDMPPLVQRRAASAFDLRMPGQLAPRDWLTGALPAADAQLCTPGVPIDSALIDVMPARLRVIGTCSVGTDHIDLAAARAGHWPGWEPPDFLGVQVSGKRLGTFRYGPHRAMRGAHGGAGTAGWLNAARLAALPKHAVVVNAARGTLVDDRALAFALAVLTPRIASAMEETRDAMGMLVLDGIEAVLVGRTPDNLVP